MCASLPEIMEKEDILCLEQGYFHFILRNTGNGNSHSETANSEGQEGNLVEWQEIAAGISLEFLNTQIGNLSPVFFYSCDFGQVAYCL